MQDESLGSESDNAISHKGRKQKVKEMTDEKKVDKTAEKVRKSIERVEALLGRKLSTDEVTRVSATVAKPKGSKKELAGKVWDLLNSVWTTTAGYEIAAEIVQARLGKSSKKMLKEYIQRLDKLPKPAKK
jgi:hypothetical protein